MGCRWQSLPYGLWSCADREYVDCCPLFFLHGIRLRISSTPTHRPTSFLLRRRRCVLFFSFFIFSCFCLFFFFFFLFFLFFFFFLIDPPFRDGSLAICQLAFVFFFSSLLPEPGVLEAFTTAGSASNRFHCSPLGVCRVSGLGHGKVLEVFSTLRSTTPTGPAHFWLFPLSRLGSKPQRVAVPVYSVFFPPPWAGFGAHQRPYTGFSGAGHWCIFPLFRLRPDTGVVFFRFRTIPQQVQASVSCPCLPS